MHKISFSIFCLIIAAALNAQNGQIYLADHGLTASGSGTNKKVSLGGTLLNAQAAIDFGSSNSSSNFLIKKGSSNYFFIANGGNVGIGTASPSALFHTNGTVRFQGLGLQNSYTRMLAVDVDGNLAYRDASTLGGGGGITLNSTQIAFGNASNQVSSSSDFTWNGTRLMLGNSNGMAVPNPVSINTGATFGSNTPGTAGNLKLRLYDNNSSTVYGLGISDGVMEYQVPAGADHRFYADGTEIMRLAGTGNVGINTTNPAYKLHLVGSGINGQTALIDLPDGNKWRFASTGMQGTLDITQSSNTAWQIAGTNLTNGLNLSGLSSPLNLNSQVSVNIVTGGSLNERRLRVDDDSTIFTFGYHDPTARDVYFYNAHTTGTNTNGGNTYWDMTAGTGSATGGGDFIIRTPDAGSSGATPQTLTEKFRITRTGRLKLQALSQGSEAKVVTWNSTTKELEWRDASTLGGGGASQWSTAINNNDIFYNTGNVGIGNSSPTYKLDVNGNARFGGNTPLTSVVVTPNGDIGVGTTPITNMAIQVQRNADATAGIRFENTNTGHNSFTALQFGYDVNTAATKFLNIGYANPNIMPYGVFHAAGSHIVSYGEGGLNMSAYNAAGGAPKMRFYTGNGVTDANLRMTIDEIGSVGIGIATIPAGYKLAIAGNIITEKVRVKLQSSGWPDYVFHHKYELLPLKDLESFIQKNKHLPDVPSATDVEANGLDIGDNQAILLKKVEELTLYIIEINKKVDKLAEENALLKKKLESNKK